VYSSLWQTHHRATEHQLPCGMTAATAASAIRVNVPRLNPSQAGLYLICLPWRDWRLSWSWYWLYVTEMVYLSAVTHLGSNDLIATWLGVILTTFCS